ncbi:hypothetical protein M2323_001549 [Rhodoblastus acidophilus]|uniref:hypothetical protein n=1 Tax=Rhodoblastus acidophilus TaxID=1074 RepID=UPI002224041E|nr:hypothetical protein [Rhodoblastus acidophilus]MCW2283940.1 hypothetical protein [Rhodoblastus acidophilus]MCW2332636.1 hypothetical protein [Rhodoblastus acidophilus]
MSSAQAEVRTGGHGAIAPLLVGLNLCIMGVALFGLALLPAAGARTVIVIPRPFGQDAATIVAQAQGFMLRGGIAGALLARGDAPDFVRRLYANGALMVLDGKALDGCASGKS